MQIGLTKKLADYSGIKIALPDAFRDPLFSWSANLLTINRRKTIICMNDASRFAFILHGIKAADVKKLDALIVNGIRRLLAAEGIAPEIVERYLSDGRAGQSASGISHTKTASRKAVAALNQVCASVEIMEARDPDVFPSEMQVLSLNRMGFSVDKDRWASPYNLFFEMLKERYGGSVVRTDAVELTVLLDLDGSEAVRRLIVPTFYTFAELHQVIQTVFCWQGYHLHEFILSQDEYGRPKETIVSIDDEREEGAVNCRLETEVRLSEVFHSNMPPEADVIIYAYDFGDDWQHFIKCERIVENYNENHAQCILMEGDAPPEDVGGPDGFQNMLEILKDEAHPEHEQMKAWIGRMQWKPLAEEDLAKTNQYLANRHYGCRWY